MDKCDEKILWLDYKNITKVVQTGSHVYVDDGLITLTVNEVGEHINHSSVWFILSVLAFLLTGTSDLIRFFLICLLRQ